MKIIIQASEGAHQREHAAAMASGLARHGLASELCAARAARPCDVAVIWGFKPPEFIARLKTFGARKIILLGYDMQCGPNGETHWFGSHPGALEKGAGLYPRFVQNFRTTLRDLERNGITVINCSRRTALDCFPRLPLEEALPA